MNIEIFAVFDAAAARYIEPFTAPTVDFALRGFKEACNTDEHQFTKFPEDYTLWHIGTFDAELGVLEGFPQAHKVALATSFVNRGDQS